MGRVKGSISKDRSIDAEALREVLKPIYEKLREKGVKDSDLPNNEDLVDRLLDFIDEKAIDEWAGSRMGETKPVTAIYPALPASGRRTAASLLAAAAGVGGEASVNGGVLAVPWRQAACVSALAVSL